MSFVVVRLCVAVVAMSSVVWIAAPCGLPLRNTVSFAPFDDLDNVRSDRVDLFPLVANGNAQWPSWVLDAAASASVELPLPRLRKTTLEEKHQGGYHLIGLARLSSRGISFHRGPLTDPDREQRFLLDLYHNPLDCAFVKVIDSAVLSTSIFVRYREYQRSSSRCSFVNIKRNICLCLFFQGAGLKSRPSVASI